MAAKLITNEFATMTDIAKVASSMSSRTLGIISVFLISFANFSFAGAVKSLHEKQGNIVAHFGLKLLYEATLVNILLAIIVNFIL